MADTYGYCQLRNHFHVLIRVREPDPGPDPKGLRDLSGLRDASRQISHLLNAYAKAINTAYSRNGSLFQHPFRRFEVDSDVYFAQLVAYIHMNPLKHRFVEDFRRWPHSSYRTLLSTAPTRLKREEVLGWFGGMDRFREFHESRGEEAAIEHLVGE